MSSESSKRSQTVLLVLIFAYGAASLVHYVHNAQLLTAYPNMPQWLSAPKIYGAWLVLTAAGIVGYLLVCKGYNGIGLSVIAAYAVFGFDGFTHYAVAPFGVHTTTMNLTIWLEAATAAVLLAAVLRLMTKQRGV
jgi:hypothetical protein